MNMRCAEFHNITETQAFTRYKLVERRIAIYIYYSQGEGLSLL